MGELAQLETKPAEVMELARAAKDSTPKVKKLVEDEEVSRTLDRMRAEAAETAKRCEELVGELEEKKISLAANARVKTAKALERLARGHLPRLAPAIPGRDRVRILHPVALPPATRAAFTGPGLGSAPCSCSIRSAATPPRTGSPPGCASASGPPQGGPTYC